MIDCSPIVVSALKTAHKNVHYELFINSKTPLPCITYRETSNKDNRTSENLKYSDIEYTVKVWSTKLSELNALAEKVDDALRPLGFSRTGSNELTLNDITQKVMIYSALGAERTE